MKNSQTHFDRIRKVLTGFQAAGISEENTNIVIASFDAKDEWDSQKIASLTEFKVGNFEGWGQDANLRRQMARALIFIENLSKIHTPEWCQKTFYSLWHYKSNVALKKDLIEAVNEFIPSGGDLGHVTSKVNFNTKKIGTTKVTITPEARKLFQKQMLSVARDRRELERANELRSFKAHKQEAMGDMDKNILNHGINLNKRFTESTKLFLSMCNKYLAAQDAALESFNKAFNSGQEVLNFKVNVFNKVVGALGEIAPPPLNIATKGLGLILDKCKAKTRESGADIEFAHKDIHQGYETDTFLGRVGQTLEGANSSLEELLRIGLAADGPPTSRAKLRAAVNNFFDRYHAQLNKAWHDEVSNFFGTQDSEGNSRPSLLSANIYSQLFSQTPDGRDKPFALKDVYSLQTGRELRKREDTHIHAMRAQMQNILKASFDREVNDHVKTCLAQFPEAYPTLDEETLSKWILISLTADYVGSLIDPIIADPTHKDHHWFVGGRSGSVVKDLGALPFADRFLAPFKACQPPLLVEIEDDKFRQVAGSNTIPWSTGKKHVQCKAILFLYLIWIRKNFKPMSMCINKDYEVQFIQASRNEIKRLGELVKNFGESSQVIANNISINEAKPVFTPK